jgi:hypothetical protein
MQKCCITFWGNGSIVLLVGSFVIGMITGEDGMQELHPFIVVPFTGVLAVFLLDMGLSAGKSLLVNTARIVMGFVWIWLFDANRWITGGVCHGPAGGIINGWHVPVDGA